MMYKIFPEKLLMIGEKIETKDFSEYGYIVHGNECYIRENQKDNSIVDVVFHEIHIDKDPYDSLSKEEYNKLMFAKCIDNDTYSRIPIYFPIELVKMGCTDIDKLKEVFLDILSFSENISKNYFYLKYNESMDYDDFSSYDENSIFYFPINSFSYNLYNKNNTFFSRVKGFQNQSERNCYGNICENKLKIDEIVKIDIKMRDDKISNLEFVID